MDEKLKTIFGENLPDELVREARQAYYYWYMWYGFVPKGRCENLARWLEDNHPYFKKQK